MNGSDELAAREADEQDRAERRLFHRQLLLVLLIAALVALRVLLV